MEPQIHIEQEARANYFWIKIDGYLTARYILGVRTTFGDVLQKHANIALDLSGIQLIDSMGIGILVNLYKQIKKKAGRLAILNPSPTACDIFEVSDMDKWLPIHNTEANPETLFS